tara:strand:+ start:3001 stop:3522 length:522 start_codon:yes stop_codon:yes gene_type:complete
LYSNEFLNFFMLAKTIKYSLLLTKRKSFILFLILLPVGCSNKINLEKNSRILFEESYYQSWVAGVRGGGSGLNIYLTLENSSTKNIQLDGIYFKDNYCKLKSLGDQKYQCSILMNENRETNFLKTPITIDSSGIQKNPFSIEGDVAVIVYLENTKRKYVKITMLWKKMQHLPM